MSAGDIRDVINISAVDIPDAQITKMIKRAEVTLELELDKELPTRIKDLESLRATFVSRDVNIS